MIPFFSRVSDWGPCNSVVSPPEVEVEETRGAGGLEIALPEPQAPQVGLCAGLTFL